jgi:DMSO reductase family type II enzyme heme b subunit
LRRYSAFAVALIVIAAGIGWLSFREPVAVKTIARAGDIGKGGDPLASASALRVSGKAWRGKVLEIVDPAHPFWASAPALQILLNHTPRIYVTDKADPTAPPDASVRCGNASDGTVITLSWADTTVDRPQVRRPSPADPSSGVKVVHSEMTSRFYDAAAVMVPVNRKPVANPCIQMGDATGPVEIYYWNAVRGAAVMKASGRGTTERTARGFQAKSSHEADGWHVTFVLPRLPQNTPVAFAIWDGSKGQRGGFKYYSLWNTLE